MTIFVVIMHIVSAAIMQVVFSAVHSAHDFVYCNYAGNSFFYRYVGDSLSNDFLSLSLTYSLLS